MFICNEGKKMAESVRRVLREVLIQESKQPSGLLAVEHCLSLLGDSNQSDQVSMAPSTEETSCFNRYPYSPLYVEIAERLALWIKIGILPRRNFKKFNLLEETSFEVDSIFKEDWPTVSEFTQSWNELDLQSKTRAVVIVIKKLGARGLLSLLGVRHTVGSIESFPPDKSIIIEAFNKKHKQGANLTVGARALSKHVHRDQSNGWWGELKGSEQAKNEQSLKILNRILNDAAWINIHSLPGELKVLEVRGSGGYGARWTHDGKHFRGFLEPQMADGHALKWRH